MAASLRRWVGSRRGKAPSRPGAALRRGLARAGLSRRLIRARHRRLARGVDRSSEPADDGYPLPPPLLLVGITGEAKSTDWYLESGRGDLGSIAELLAGQGVDAAGLGAVLDFGCGCGRVARRWARFPDVRIHGCDYDPEMVAWCSENLPFVEARKNELDPPLPYEGGSFDLVYAFSVFTHLDEQHQTAWLEEMRRVLKPEGMLLFSALGERHARDALGSDQRERFGRGELVVERPEVSGEGVCLTYHPPAWTEAKLTDAGFELLERFDEKRPFRGSHDFYLVRPAA